MNREEIKTQEEALFKRAELPPKAVHEQWKTHDRRMREVRAELALQKATYLTEFWDWIDDIERATPISQLRMAALSDRIEVNRVKPALTGYLSALYPRSLRAVLGRLATTTGDPDKSALLLNRWLADPVNRERVILASRQGLVYGCAGAKVGFEPVAGPGARSAVERTWTTVFPRWELLLDADVHDWADQRFIGHLHHRAKEEVEEAYGLTDLVGTSRDDFLARGALRSQEKKTAIRAEEEAISPSDRRAFVRVLELCNLCDGVEVDGRWQDGRLEIYVLDQGREELPVWMGPLPMESASGQGVAHIAPLIFDYELEFPLRPVAYVKQLMPQQVEVNVFRSYQSQSAKRDARGWLRRKGAIHDDEMNKITSGRDGAVGDVDPAAYDGPLSGVLWPIPMNPVSVNVREASQQAEVDLERVTTISPAALGVVTKATAQEVRAVEAHTESEFGRHAEARDRWLSTLLTLVLRATVAAMRSDAGHDQPAVADRSEVDPDAPPAPMGPTLTVGAIEPGPTTTAAEAGRARATGETAEGGEAEEPEDDALVSAAGSGPDAAGGEAAEAAPESRLSRVPPLRLLDPSGEPVEVRLEDIDSDFDIGFSESGRTPVADEQQRQALVVLADRYLSLMAEAAKDGPLAPIALAYARALYTRFDLPKDLDPDRLLAAAAEAKEKAPKPTSAEAPEPAAAPVNGGTGADLGALRAIPADQAIAVLRSVAAEHPVIGQAVERAAALQEPARSEAVARILDAMGAPAAPSAASVEV